MCRKCRLSVTFCLSHKTTCPSRIKLSANDTKGHVRSQVYHWVMTYRTKPLCNGMNDVTSGSTCKVVQERLGHAKVGTTMDIYSHVMPTLQKEAVKGFDLALETAGSGP